ncbi:DUF488 domain-containing protein [Bradyrhizobium sp. ISRA443]|uniref:DUF488 domain-containing protein n=1 Tax=unclassified Bradyrhizobium TaxID=2631580 RepID=UPI00247A8E1E|nr:MULTISPECIES: DUF488 domain-containing protein [unclassified Bradyrhizobium]WGR98596.1 DUF488 domain-containing protein [Bradyrhizobium sp. ISRA436]WGS05485.1 DUF488 domain-containing protein [Bradyrhizobium sp. ISRA437]WGS12372.1 DUF488 domain-containing protein [Bradyrhizobium sp. ISRA443]
MTLPFFTIGHSTRSLEDFIALLAGAGIDRVVDVRTVPRSRTNPQFNKDALPEPLAAAGISYEHVADLGGLRGKARSLPPVVNGFWTNDSFHNYADYALSAQFHLGLQHLREEGHRQRCVIMCSEAVWWRCHRRIVADYLIASGETVFHIMGQGRLEPARLTEGAVVQGDGTVVYPAAERPDT